MELELGNIGYDPKKVKIQIAKMIIDHYFDILKG